MPNDTPAVTPKKSDWMEICTRWVHIKKESNFPLPMNCIPNFSSGWEPSSLYLGDPKKGKQCMQITRWSWLWPPTAKPGMDGIKPHVRETWQYWPGPSLLTDVPLQMPFWTGTEIMIAELCPWRQIHPQPECVWAACRLRICKRQSPTILTLTHVCAYETHNTESPSMKANQTSAECVWTPSLVPSVFTFHCSKM